MSWQFKLQTVVKLPFGFQASANLDHHTNAHRLRTRTIPASVVGIPSTIVVLQPRGELGRLPDVSILDGRVQKDFTFGGARATLLLDALNLLNENAPQAVQSTNVTSSVYQYPQTFVAPRRFMLSAKFSF